MNTKYLLPAGITVLIAAFMMSFGCRPNPVEKPAVVPTAVAVMIDDFEDGEFISAVNGSAWEKSAKAGSSVTATVEPLSGGEGAFSLHVAANNVGDGWAWTYFGNYLDTGGGTSPVDLTLKRNAGYRGFRMRTQGTIAAGTAVIYYIQLISTGTSADSSHWRYTWTPVSSWTTLEIPWSSFSSPGWGAGDSLTLDQVLQTAKMLSFSLSSNVQDGANNVGSTWDIDNLEYY